MRKFQVTFDGCKIHAPMTEGALKLYIERKMSQPYYSRAHVMKTPVLADFEVVELIPVKLKLNLEIM